MAELYAEFGEDVLHTQSTRRNPIWDTIDELEPGEALVIERSEWPIKNNPGHAVNSHYKQKNRKFRTRLTKDKIFIARTV